MRRKAISLAIRSLAVVLLGARVRLAAAWVCGAGLVAAGASWLWGPGWAMLIVGGILLASLEAAVSPRRARETSRRRS